MHWRYKICCRQVNILDDGSNVVLKIVSDPIYYYFYCHINGEETYLGKAQTKYLSSEVAGGFTGTVMAMYAVAFEKDKEQWVDFTDLLWEQKNSQ
jgi:alpha-N-arabinofuranosidase